eukprot:NODE_297_length_11469_cov_0.855937.p2 type:complete len:502 gc:universal NODE_297_length_11469_cov_0.855937:11236-9731(-)
MFSIAMSNSQVTTENNAVSHGTTYSNTLNMFFKFVRGVEAEYITSTVNSAYKENKLNALKVIFHRRDCRGGVGERSVFHIAMVALYQLDPDTVILNLDKIPFFGRWDDLFYLIPCCPHEVLALVSKQLEADLASMKDGKPVSLCSKWFPSEKCRLDVEFGVYSKMCEFMNITPKALRKKYLTPLRKYLKIVELFLSSQQFDKINFEAVPSQAMTRLRKAFEKRCPHWQSYLNELKKGNVKVNAKTTDPHQLVAAYIEGTSDGPDVIIEEQWKVKEKEILQFGGLSKSLAIVDVSGSMTGDNAILVAVALGLLISRSTAEAFRDCVMTFDSVPEFIKLKNKQSLHDSVKEIMEIPWGGSTNFTACFSLLLERALTFQYPENHPVHPGVHGLMPEEMPDKIICISDMQFDSAGKMTNFDTVKELYSKSSYKMPTLVFWNVRANTVDFPTTQNEENVALISGFNVNILKSICSGKISTPFDVMMQAINDERYNVLKLQEPFVMV